MLRPATPDDAPALLEILAPVAVELELFDAAELRDRVREGSARDPWLVAEDAAGGVLGLAYARAWRAGPAYRHTAEVAIHVRARARGAGVGSRLCAALLAELAGDGHVGAIAVLALPAPRTVAFYERAGFAPVGVVPVAGHQRGRRYDVGLWHRRLAGPGSSQV